MSEVKGEARFKYEPGVKPPQALPVDEGDYFLTLKNKGKEGLAGWKSKPGKFPNRRVVLNITGTEDEVTGEEKTLTIFLSLSPKVLRQNVAEVAWASNYPDGFELARYSKPGDPGVLEMQTVVDAILDHINSNSVTLKARVGQEEFNGNMQNRLVRWLDASEAIEEAEVPAEEEVEAEEEEAPAPPPKKPLAKPVAKKPLKNGKHK